MKKVGVIGVGNMGKCMAANLLHKGYLVTVYDVNEQSVQELVHMGATRGLSPKDVTDRTDVVVLSLPNVTVLKHVFSADKEEGILASDRVEGTTFIDTTTSTMEASVELAQQVFDRGGSMLDSPVTGGAQGAEKGTLSIMVGGDYAAFEKQMDIYKTLGSHIVYIGESGHGQVTKMVNQMLMAALYCSVSESYGFAAQLGLDVEKVYEALEDGGGKSGIHSMMKKLIVSGRTKEGGGLGQHGKDIDYVMEEANRFHSYLPMTAAAHEVWNLARLKGMSPLSSSSMFTFWEDILGKKLNQQEGERIG